MKKKTKTPLEVRSLSFAAAGLILVVAACSSSYGELPPNTSNVDAATETEAAASDDGSSTADGSGAPSTDEDAGEASAPGPPLDKSVCGGLIFYSSMTKLVPEIPLNTDVKSDADILLEPGVVEEGFRLDFGQLEYKLPDTTSLAVARGSIRFFYKPGWVLPCAQPNTILTGYPDGEENDHVGPWLFCSENSLHYQYRYGPAGFEFSEIVVTAEELANVVSVNQWVSVVLTWDVTDSLLGLHVGTIKRSSPAQLSLGSATRFAIGELDGTFAHAFDELAIYSRVLTAEEIAGLANAKVRLDAFCDLN